MADKSLNLFERIAHWVKDTADWVQHHLGDPALGKALREDLGLAGGQPIDTGQLKGRAKTLDVDQESFEATVAEIKSVVDELRAIAEQLKGGVSGQSTWDIVYLLGRVALADSIRVRFPLVHAVLKLGMLVSDDPDEVDRLDPAMLMKLLRGESQDLGGADVDRIMAAVSLFPVGLEILFDKLEWDVPLDFLYGWDPVPASSSHRADLASARTLTMVLGKPGNRGAISATGLPAGHPGPGMMLAVGGKATIAVPPSPQPGEATGAFEFGSAGALTVYVPFEGGGDFSADAAGDMFARLTIAKPGAAGKPAFLLGEPARTRIEFGSVAGGVEIAKDRVAVFGRIKDGALVVSPEGTDSFLKKILDGDVRIAFDLGLRFDNTHGLVVEGGTGLRATIPVETTVLDRLTVHHVTVGFGPGETRDVALEVSGSFGLKLGPFEASVDRLGFTMDLALGRPNPNLGFVDLGIGLKPPNGIGLLLDAGIVKGGGFLTIDADAGEYAGALELSFNLPSLKIGIKAIGVLSTRMPDGSDGWALLLLIYGQFPRMQLGWGFTLNGLGGMIGLQHGVSVNALVDGLRTGALDDILFPKDPVGDAPRIIQRLRAVFPVTPRSLIVGPMVEIGWGSATDLMRIRLGVILQLDNALGAGPEPVSFGRIVILGQLAITAPVAQPTELTFLNLLADFLGVIETNPFSVGFAARLRDSYAGKTPFRVDFGGMMVLRATFGSKPSFVVAAGGFHPDFHEVPDGLPAPIDRLNAAFPVGPIRLRIEGYFATTPASIQAGASVALTAKLGPVGLEAQISFDAICYLKSTFHFDVRISASAHIKFKGHNLAGIAFEFQLQGPGLWHARGKGSFSILFWDIDVPFDEQWGAAATVPAASTDAAQLLRAELQTAANWAAQMPLGTEPLVSIGTIAGLTQVPAHPLGTLTFTQRTIPFDLELQKVGQTAVAGPNRFAIASAYIGTPQNARPATPLQQQFAIGEFRNLSDAEKLNAPGFQPLTAGARFGDTQYTAGPPAPDQTMEYETLYLKPDAPLRAPLGRSRLRGVVGGRHLIQAARAGAAGRSRLRGVDRMIPAAAAKVVVSDPPLATADRAAMKAGTPLAGAARTAPALAADVAANAAGLQVVEAFELA